MSTSDLPGRQHQIFPVLNDRQIESARRFASGGPRRFGPGEAASTVGDRGVPAWIILEGSLDIHSHDGLAGDSPIVCHTTGHISGEVSQLSGRPALAGARAGPDGCVVLEFNAAHLKALVIGSADIGELVMRAFILRRVALIDSGSAGSVLIGSAGSADLVRLQGFLSRNGYPHRVLDPASDSEGLMLIERLGIIRSDLPLMVCPNGNVLRRPSDSEVAVCLGIIPRLDPEKVYDVAIIGAGPSGLAAAVYAASEGLDVIVVDQRSVGGQAGASTRIENYLGFPTGISGQALAGRAFNQALKFGAEIALPLQVKDLIPSTGDRPVRLAIDNGSYIDARTVVLATGARYRKPRISNISALESGAVSYWASAIEAKLCENDDVVLVGGGNSAGQAIAFLAPGVRRIHLVIRRSLSETMSSYLIDRIAALPNVIRHVGCEVTDMRQDCESGRVNAVLRELNAGAITELDVRKVFLFIGADPNTDWLQDRLLLDDRGFVRTGAGLLRGNATKGARVPSSLETSIPNVFAVGDVRSGSTKRVAAAVGEGASVVGEIHLALKALSERSPLLI